MPKVISSAIKFYPRGCEYFQIFCGKRHSQIFEVMWKLGFNCSEMKCEQGFMTDEDQFVNRYDAYYIASAAGQILPTSNLAQVNPNEEKLYTHELYSEDVW